MLMRFIVVVVGLFVYSFGVHGFIITGLNSTFALSGLGRDAGGAATILERRSSRRSVTTNTRNACGWISRGRPAVLRRVLRMPRMRWSLLTSLFHVQILGAAPPVGLVPKQGLDILHDRGFKKVLPNVVLVAVLDVPTLACSSSSGASSVMRRLL